MPDLGLSFSPTSGQQAAGGAGGRLSPSGGASPVMDAIKILSFRVPQTLGPSAPVAPGLLAGLGGATPGLGGDHAALLQQWLQRFFGQGLTPAGEAASPPNPLGGGDQGRPTIQLGQQGPLDATPPAPPAQTWGDLGGARRSLGPPMIGGDRPWLPGPETQTFSG